MFSDMACHHDQVLDDCAYTPPFYRMLHRVSRADALVANHTQDVVGRHRKFQNKLICVELSGRKPFQIHIGLDFTVELPAFPMGMVKGNDIMVRKLHIHILHIYLHVCREEVLSMLVDTTLGYFIHSTDSEWMLFPVGTSIGNIPPCRADINGLPLAGTGNVQAFVFHFLQPFLFAFLAEIAFADEGTSALQKNTNVIG